MTEITMEDRMKRIRIKGKVYWRDIQPMDIIFEDKTGWTVNGKRIYWVGGETKNAQSFLRRRSVKSVKRVI